LAYRSGEEGVVGPLRIRAYLRDEGLHVQVPYRDPDLCAPKKYQQDNECVLSFVVEKNELDALADKMSNIGDEVAAKSIARKNKTRILDAIKKSIEEDGLSFPGGKPRRLQQKDFVCSSSVDGGNDSANTNLVA
jgi:hypothetical protein